MNTTGTSTTEEAMTPTALKAIKILARIGQGRPVKAAVFDRAMWPEETSRPIPANNPKRNLLAGGFLSKLAQKGLVEKVYYEGSRELRGYVLTPEALEALGPDDPRRLVNILRDE
jgi:hypothetical protein